VKTIRKTKLVTVCFVVILLLSAHTRLLVALSPENSPTLDGSVIGYIVPMEAELQTYPMKAINMINKLLNHGIPVFWAAEPFAAYTEDYPMGYTFAKGDFIIPINPLSTVNGIPAQILTQAYVQKLSYELCVRVCVIIEPLTVEASQLKKTEVAVYYGEGTSGGALWHVFPLEETGFEVNIVTEEDVWAGKLAEYDDVTFPGGAFYSWYVGAEGCAKVIDFVEAGGGFIGTCGGNVFGVELGLLDVQLVMIAPYWPAAADLRGPVIMRVEAPEHPVMDGYIHIIRNEYFVGQFFEYVGPNVTTLMTYQAPTPELKLFYPEISKAYGYVPISEIEYWGYPGAVAGTCKEGKVALFGTHPECLSESQRIFLNSAFYTTAVGPITLVLPMNQPITITTETSIETAQLPAIWPIMSNLTKLKIQSLLARSTMLGIEEIDEKITDAVGEYTVLFLDDILDRVDRLMVEVPMLKMDYAKLECLEAELQELAPYIPPEEYKTVMEQVGAAQGKIGVFLNETMKVAHLIQPMKEIRDSLFKHREDIYELLALWEEYERTGDPAILDQYYKRVIEVYNNETEILHRLKLEEDYYLLKLTFMSDKAEEYAEYAIFLAELEIAVARAAMGVSAEAIATTTG